MTDSKTKACHACARAKRKCGKEAPGCRRCRAKGFQCVYPAPKPSCFFFSGYEGTVEVEDDDPLLDPPSSTAHPQEISGLDTSAPAVTHNLTNPHGGMIGRTTPTSWDIFPESQEPWFLAPGGWLIDHNAVKDDKPFQDRALERYIATIQEWLGEWVDSGSNPFIHSKLYQFRFPHCLQDAYTALSCYLRKTESNHETIMGIISDRAGSLVSVASSEHEIASSELDLLDHVARVHALVVYETIRLFDGDIRHRHQAEEALPTLTLWSGQMLNRAADISLMGGKRAMSSVLTQSGRMQSGPSAPVLHPSYPVVSIVTSSTSSSESDGETLWYAWVVSETVRRTWTLASGLHAVYGMLQRGWAGCSGGVMFTTRKGLWESQSASEWQRRCEQADVWFVQWTETHKLLEEVPPEEVDEFGKAMLEITYGAERAEQWGMSVSRKGWNLNR